MCLKGKECSFERIDRIENERQKQGLKNRKWQIIRFESTFIPLTKYKIPHKSKLNPYQFDEQLNEFRDMLKCRHT